MIKHNSSKCTRAITGFCLILFCTLNLYISTVIFARASTRNGVFVTKWGSYGSGNGQFTYPNEISTDRFGHVYVSDYSKGVSYFETNGNFQGQLTSFVSGGIAINGSGWIYVLEKTYRKVIVYNERLSLDHIFFPLAGDWNHENQGIAINGSGYVYLTDSLNHKVNIFTPFGEFVKGWTLIDAPSGIAISPEGHVYITFISPSGVKKFDQNGVFIRDIAIAGSEENQVSSPYGVATDQSGYVYVTDSGHHRILVFDSNGNLNGSWGVTSEGSGQLSTPYGISVNDQQYIFVTDPANHCVLVFSPPAIADFWITVSIISISIFTIVVVVMRRQIHHKYLAIKNQLRQKWQEKRKNIVERQRLRKEQNSLRIQQKSSKIEQVILELAPQFSRLQVGEIAERCGVSDESLIIKVLQQMIARKQIDATYFKSTLSVAFQQYAIEKPFPHEVSGVARQYMEVRRQYEYMGGKIRLKVKVVNTGKVGLLRIQCMLNIPDSFRLLRVEPTDYSAEGSAVKLQDLLPKEEKSVAYVLEPMICGKEQFSGTVSGVDAAGGPFAISIDPLEVEVRCPLFATPEEANLPLVKKMALDLPVKSERVFYLPETLAPATAFELAKSAISERDVRFVGSVTGENRKDGDPFDEAAWFYGTTKVEKKRYVLSAAVSEKDRVIRLATACDDEAGCTGFLAETGAAVRRELVRRGAFESEKDVIELVCEKCGATLPSAPTLDHDVRCPECQWSWRAQDFFR